MPTRRRGGDGPLKASVLYFLNTGEIALRPGDNVWMRISLMDGKAHLAHVAWVCGDEPGARALLDRCPGLPGWCLE